jgi:thiol-disulfide isomerase/thioredoxin
MEGMAMERARSLGVIAILVGVAGCDVYGTPDRPLPDIKATMLDGRSMPADMFEGKPWVINVWVPGCTLCAREFPDLEAVRKEWEPRGVGFLALSLHPDDMDVKQAAQRVGIGMTVAIARDQVLAALGVAAVPSTVFVSAEGRIVATANGARSRGFFERRVRDLVEANGGGM